jgi:FkbM family methyltransferase
VKRNLTIGAEATLSTPDWETYLWECNPQLIKWYLNDLVKKEPNVQLIPHAASTSNGELSFYLTAGQESAAKNELPNAECDPNSQYNPGGASTFYGNAKRAGEKITVATIDFLAWHKALNLQPNDIVHMKMDIEGAELGIVQAFLADDTNQICYWQAFWNEYHKEIFEQGTADYLAHEKFERDFPQQFAQKCGRPLWPNDVG